MVNFDRVSRIYRTLETIAFGRALQRARIRWLRELSGTTRALIVGEGDGRFVGELLKTYPHLQIDCVEASGRMIELARRRLKEGGADVAQVRFFQADIFSWSPRQKYDLIVTHFLLDCFNEAQLEAIVTKLALAAEPDAIWLLADFRIPTTGALATNWAKLWIRVMYLFFRITAGLQTTTLIDPSPYLCATGFSLTNESLTRCGMIKSQVWRKSVS
jgi:ubiquinone/menaquinone biosynthesis C-methylase UbiE